MPDEKNNPIDGTFSQVMSMQSPAAKPAESESPHVDSSGDERPDERSPQSTVDGAKQRTIESTNERRKKRSLAGANEGKDESTNDRSGGDGLYAIALPAQRQKRRASFDIFNDQKAALDKLQLAAVDAGEKRPNLGDMIQEAIDAYIRRRAKQLPNVRINREPNG